MPLYPFKCSKCGKEFDKFASMEDAPLKVKCFDCGGLAHRNWNAYGQVDSQNKEYSMEGSNGTRMYPAAVLNEKQLEKARKEHPGFDWQKHNGCYLPVIKNRMDKLKFLKQKNWVELD